MSAATTAGRLDPIPGWIFPDTEWNVAKGFWDGVGRRELCFPQCQTCHDFVWYPEPRCQSCGGHEFKWQEVSPVGTVHSFTVIRRAFLPELAPRLPLGVVLARFAGAPGVTLVSALAPGEDPERLAVGLPLEVVFEAAPNGFLFPLIRLG
jgi:uncharacterized OB-fold protein